VADWLAIRGTQPGALFCAINKGGHLVYGPMTAQALYNLLTRRGQAAGIKDFSPHDMRRTFCGDMLAAGADIAVVAKLMGHASVNTTARYDRRPEQAKKAASGLLHVPYHGKLIR
jgi:site-specific recombinase XerD